MVEKDDLQNLGGDWDLSRRRFLFELSFGLPDTVPSPGIVFVRLRRSNDGINHMILTIFPDSFAYGISAT